MNPIPFFSAFVLASLVSTPLLAGEHDHRRTPTAERNLQDMRPVPTSVSAASGTAGKCKGVIPDNGAPPKGKGPDAHQIRTVVV